MFVKYNQRPRMELYTGYCISFDFCGLSLVAVDSILYLFVENKVSLSRLDWKFRLCYLGGNLERWKETRRFDGVFESYPV